MNLLKRVFAPLAALIALCSPTTASARAAHTARPALWAVSDADTTVYLFGTIHLLPSDYAWRTPRFDQAVNGSQQLVVETIIDEKNPLAMMSAMSSLAFSQGLPPLADRVPPQKRAALAAAIKKSGMPPQALDRMETWAAAFILLGNQFKEMGLQSEGVEAVLRREFASKGKTIGQLESNVQQLSFFDTLPEEAQRALLEGAIDDPRNATEDFKGMLAAWVRGDVASIAKTFDRDLGSTPALQHALIRRRNANWTKWIEQRMAVPGSVLVAVGAGHLAGKHSVVELLKQGGYRVKRIQ